MAKKILATLAGTLVAILALAFGLITIYQNREYFSIGISWLLIACFSILIVVVLVLCFSSIADIRRKNKNDENLLNEKKLEKIFSGESARKQHTATAAAAALAQEKQKQKELEEAALRVRKQEEYEAAMAAKIELERRQEEEEAARQRAQIEAKAHRIAAAEAEARRRATQELDEADRLLALSEVEALRRAAQETQLQLAAEDAARLEKQKEQELQEKAEQEAAELRKTQAIEGMRKQAAAAAAARRRAAMRAAQTQSFSVSDLRAAALETSSPSEESAPLNTSTGTPERPNIWEEMQITQSANQLFADKDPALEHTRAFIEDAATAETSSTPAQRAAAARALGGNNPSLAYTTQFNTPNNLFGSSSLQPPILPTISEEEVKPNKTTSKRTSATMGKQVYRAGKKDK